MLKKQDQIQCTRCSGLLQTDHKRGRILCTGCGLVSESSIIDQQSEYRYFSENTKSTNDPRRVGNPINIYLDGQLDLIDIDDGQRSHHVFAAQSNQDKQFQLACRMIKRFSLYLDLNTQLTKYAENIYYDVQDKEDMRGKRMELVALACLYLACRRNFVNLHPVALEPLADVSQGKILKVCKVILRHIPKVNISPAQYAEMFGTKLQIGQEQRADVRRICEEILQWDFFNKQMPKPRTIAAAVIYFYLSKVPSEGRVTLQAIKDAAGISTDHTIKKYYKDLEEKAAHLSDLIGKDLTGVSFERQFG